MTGFAVTKPTHPHARSSNQGERQAEPGDDDGDAAARRLSTGAKPADGEHQGDRNRVQHAEPDVTARKNEVARQTYRDRTGADEQHVAPETAATAGRALGEHEAPARQEQERRQDGGARVQPPGIAIEIETARRKYARSKQK